MNCVLYGMPHNVCLHLSFHVFVQVMSIQTQTNNEINKPGN